MCPAAAAPLYEVTILPFPGSGRINNAGQVTGADATQMIIYRWENGVATTVATMPGAFPPYTSVVGAYPTALSESGTVAGQMVGVISPNGQDSRAAIFNGLATDLGALPGSTSYTGAQSARAIAINDSGVAVGICTDHTATSRAVIFSGGSVTQIGTGQGIAYDINNSGKIVGLSNSQGFFSTVASPASTTTLAPFAADVFTEPARINQQGIAVGRSKTSQTAGDPDRIVTWNNGAAPTEVGVFAGMDFHRPSGINQSLEIVGMVRPTGTFLFEAFYCDPSGNFFLLHDLLDPADPDADGLDLTSVGGINDNGWIAGRGTKTGTGTVAVLLKPIAAPPVLEVLSIDYVGGATPEFRVTVPSQIGFEYQLNRSPDGVLPFVPVGSPVPGTGLPVDVSHTVSPGGAALYKVSETESGM